MLLIFSTCRLYDRVLIAHATDMTDVHLLVDRCIVRCQQASADERVVDCILEAIDERGECVWFDSVPGVVPA